MGDQDGYRILKVTICSKGLEEGGTMIVEKRGVFCIRCQSTHELWQKKPTSSIWELALPDQSMPLIIFPRPIALLHLLHRTGIVCHV